MIRAFRYLVPLTLALAFTGCVRQSVGSQGGDLTVIYLSDLPDDPEGWADMAFTLGQMKGNPLVVVDDTAFTYLNDLISWQGEKEVFLLEAMGSDLYFPNSDWDLLGYERLAELSSSARFFIVALNVADDSGNYPLSRYLIRQHSPYRVAFSSAYVFDEKIDNLRSLPLDSILPVTASFLRMHSDYFFFFGSARDSIPEGVNLIPRYVPNSRIDIRFQSPSQVKLKVREFKLQAAPAGTPSPLHAWYAYEDSLDSELLLTSDDSLTRDSLNSLALQTLKRLAALEVAEGDIGFVAVEELVSAGVPAGNVTLGMMRKVMPSEAFYLVDMRDVEDVLFSGDISGDTSKGKEWVLVPLSGVLESEQFRGKRLEPTGITTVKIASQMFKKEN